MTRQLTPPCVWHARHWFAYYGEPGSSSPVCVRGGCHHPNPRYDPDRDTRREVRS